MDIKRPIITEKSLGLASRGWYTFAAAKHTRKEDLAREVEKMYHVNVISIRTVAMHGKVRRTGKKMISSRQTDWKKAIVQVKPGQKIDAFEVTSQPAPAEAKAVPAKEAEANEANKLETQQKGKVKK